MLHHPLPYRVPHAQRLVSVGWVSFPHARRCSFLYLSLSSAIEHSRAWWFYTAWSPSEHDLSGARGSLRPRLCVVSRRGSSCVLEVARERAARAGHRDDARLDDDLDIVGNRQVLGAKNLCLREKFSAQSPVFAYFNASSRAARVCATPTSTAEHIFNPRRKATVFISPTPV